MDGIPSLPGYAQWVIAGLLALLGKRGVDFLRLWLERNKPKVEQHLLGAQAEEALARAGKTRAEGEVSLVETAISLARELKVENQTMRVEVADLNRRMEMQNKLIMSQGVMMLEDRQKAESAEAKCLKAETEVARLEGVIKELQKV